MNAAMSCAALGAAWALALSFALLRLGAAARADRARRARRAPAPAAAAPRPRRPRRAPRRAVPAPRDAGRAVPRSTRPPPGPSRRSSCRKLEALQAEERPRGDARRVPRPAARDFNLMIKTGGAANPPDRAGLADLDRHMLDEGTKTRSALVIADEIASLGATLSTGSTWDASNVSLSIADREPGRGAGGLRRRRPATRPSTPRSSRASATTC